MKRHIFTFLQYAATIHATGDRNAYVMLKIQDKGIGIPADRQKHLFDKFYRVPTGNLHNVKGYGLGLYYVKTMAEQHKGSITVESNIGKGSTFILQIPGK